MFIFPPDDMPTEAEVYEAEQNQEFEYVQEVISSIEHLSIVKTSGDELAPAGYFNWFVDVGDDKPVSGEPMETPMAALGNYLDWTVKWMRQEFQ